MRPLPFSKEARNSGANWVTAIPLKRLDKFSHECCIGAESLRAMALLHSDSLGGLLALPCILAWTLLMLELKSTGFPPLETGLFEGLSHMGLSKGPVLFLGVGEP